MSTISYKLQLLFFMSGLCPFPSAADGTSGVSTHLGQAVMPPFADWYSSLVWDKQPKCMMMMNFLFLSSPAPIFIEVDLCLPKRKKKNHAAKCRPCIFSIVTWNNFTVPFRESFSTDFWLGIPKHICTAGILKCMRSVKAVNLEVHGKEVGGWCSNNRGRSFYFKIDWWMPLK